ncbi:PHD finger protein 3 [Pelomyxa schiedti]|nr:PHD finger protein 3 [Pelomyxa schiedti]
MQQQPHTTPTTPTGHHTVRVHVPGSAQQRPASANSPTPQQQGGARNPPTPTKPTSGQPQQGGRTAPSPQRQPQATAAAPPKSPASRKPRPQQPQQQQQPQQRRGGGTGKPRGAGKGDDEDQEGGAGGEDKSGDEPDENEEDMEDDDDEAPDANDDDDDYREGEDAKKRAARRKSAPGGARPRPSKSSSGGAGTKRKKRKSSDDEDGDEENKLYCFCRSKDDGSFMIQCDICEEWYHGKCVGISQRASKGIKTYVCKRCESKPQGTSQPVPATAPDSPKKATAKIPAKIRASVPTSSQDDVSGSDGSDSDQRARRASMPAPGTKTVVASPDSTKVTIKGQPQKQIPITTRNSAIEKLSTILGGKRDIAEQIEAAVHDSFSNSSKTYASKIRSLQSNLKDAKNPLLRDRIISGELSPEHLAQMTPQQLANPDLINWRKSREKKSMETVVVQEGTAPDMVIEKQQAEKAAKLIGDGSVQSLPRYSDSASPPTHSHTRPAEPPPKKSRTTGQGSDVSPSARLPTDADASPIGWQFTVNKPPYPPFVVCGTYACGRPIDSSVLPQTLDVTGRLPIDRLLNYLVQLGASATRKRTTICLEPVTEQDRSQYNLVFDYFTGRERAGHANVDNALKQPPVGIEEIYLLPVRKEADLPEFMRTDPTLRAAPGQADRLYIILVTRIQGQGKPQPRPQALPQGLPQTTQPQQETDTVTTVQTTQVTSDEAQPTPVRQLEQPCTKLEGNTSMEVQQHTEALPIQTSEELQPLKQEQPPSEKLPPQEMVAATLPSQHVEGTEAEAEAPQQPESVMPLVPQEVLPQPQPEMLPQALPPQEESIPVPDVVHPPVESHLEGHPELQNTEAIPEVNMQPQDTMESTALTQEQVAQPAEAVASEAAQTDTPLPHQAVQPQPTSTTEPVGTGGDQQPPQLPQPQPELSVGVSTTTMDIVQQPEPIPAPEAEPVPMSVAEPVQQEHPVLPPNQEETPLPLENN